MHRFRSEGLSLLPGPLLATSHTFPKPTGSRRLLRSTSCSWFLWSRSVRQLFSPDVASDRKSRSPVRPFHPVATVKPEFLLPASYAGGLSGSGQNLLRGVRFKTLFIGTDRTVPMKIAQGVYKNGVTALNGNPGIFALWRMLMGVKLLFRSADRPLNTPALHQSIG